MFVSQVSIILSTFVSAPSIVRTVRLATLYATFLNEKKIFFYFLLTEDGEGFLRIAPTSTADPDPNFQVIPDPEMDPILE
jgi:hypothetical protein